MSTPQSNPVNQVDPARLQAEQKEVWNRAADTWSEMRAIAGPAEQAVSDRLIALAHLVPGQRVLDIATGAGDPALAAAQVVGPSGSVVGIDQAPQMLAAARERAAAAGLANVTFIQGNAQTLDLAPESFDAVLSRWGLMFFLPLVPALAGFRRVLRPGGYLAAAVWGSAEQVPIISAGIGAVFGQLGMPLPPPDAPGPFNLANADKLAQSLTDAGFHDVRTESLTMSVTFPSAEVFARFQRATNQMIVGLIARQPADRQAALWETVAQAGAWMASPDGSITLHNRCICVVGRA